MVSKPQIGDCLERGWIVLVPNHRLCPQVNILEGPITDIRDLLAWVYDGSLDKFLEGQGYGFRADMEKVVAFGTSSGGTLALCLVFPLSLPWAIDWEVLMRVGFRCAQTSESNSLTLWSRRFCQPRLEE